MDIQQLVRSLKTQNDSKIVMLVADGLGGLPIEPDGPTELEVAHTPNLDALARRGVSGSMIPIKPGITPGSGPGHLGLFGYDPVRYLIPRGALEATGIGFKLEAHDVATRCNFCTLGPDGNVTNRRGGAGRTDRLSTEEGKARVEKLRAIQIPGVQVFVEPVREHRFVVVFRAEGLGENVDDTDPQATDVPPLRPVAKDPQGERTAKIALDFITQAQQLLGDQQEGGRPKGNGLLMRGFSHRPHMLTFEEVYGLRAAAIAVYPMYKGLAQLVGMEIVGSPGTLKEEIDVLERAFAGEHDFFFVHFKYTDSRGEDGDFDAKVKAIEEFDAVIPRVTALEPTVLIVTGDHSTPAHLRSHSWHPVPTLLYGQYVRADDMAEFGERACARGSLGVLPAKDIMPLALANAQRIAKFSS